MTKEEIQKNSEHWYNKYKDAEKKIAELENKIADNREERKKLCADFENMKGTLESKIAELEQENERLKGDLELWESGGCRATKVFECGVVKELKEQLTKKADTNHSLVEQMADLESKNAELVKTAETFQATAYKSSVLLTKAKEIIREIMKYDIPTLDYEKAEQFLKEIEK